MKNKGLPKIVLGMVSVVIVMSLAVAGCSSSPSTTGQPSAPAGSSPSATGQPSKPATTSPSSATPASTPSTLGGASLQAKGEEIFQKTAGGIGCKTCHGIDAKGIAPAPNIRDMSSDDIEDALNEVSEMAFIHLSSEDIDAVAAYLKYLSTQP